jgi:hypothetical protein
MRPAQPEEAKSSTTDFSPLAREMPINDIGR